MDPGDQEIEPQPPVRQHREVGELCPGQRWVVPLHRYDPEDDADGQEDVECDEQAQAAEEERWEGPGGREAVRFGGCGCEGVQECHCGFVVCAQGFVLCSINLRATLWCRRSLVAQCVPLAFSVSISFARCPP